MTTAAGRRRAGAWSISWPNVPTSGRRRRPPFAHGTRGRRRSRSSRTWSRRHFPRAPGHAVRVLRLVRPGPDLQITRCPGRESPPGRRRNVLLQSHRTGRRDPGDPAYTVEFLKAWKFEANRKKYPPARSFEIKGSGTNLRQLGELSKSLAGSDPMPFDHIVAFRPGIPIVPMVNFRDADSGGDIQLSGLFDEDVVPAFAAQLGRDAKRLLDPVLAQIPGWGAR